MNKLLDTDLAQLSMVAGGILVALGVVGFIASGAASITALIPAFIGAVMIASGFVASSQAHLRKHAMHVSAGIALLGALGTLGSLIGRANVASASAVFSLLLTLVVLLAFVALAVRSFIQARKQRQQGDA